VKDDERVTEIEQRRRPAVRVARFVALSSMVVAAYRAARPSRRGLGSEADERAATVTDSGTPGLEIGGAISAAWREEALARARGLRFLEAWIRSQPDQSGLLDACIASIDVHLKAAEDASAPPAGAKFGKKVRRTWHALAGSPFESALANLDMAEVDLLRLARGWVLEGAQPGIQAHVNRYLAKDDPRRLALDGLAKEKLTRAPPRLQDNQRELLLNALFAANTQRRRNLARVRSFRNMLRGGIFAAVVLAIALALVGFLWQDAIPLCFSPETDGAVTVACPQRTQFVGLTPLDPAKVSIDSEMSAAAKPSDILLVEFLGFFGAVVSVVALFRRLRRGTATPYNVPFSLAILKLPAGAVSAVAGLLLMRADFVPGLSALDTPAQVLGWALIFGIAQQLVTRLADNRADALLEDVGGRGAGGDRPLSSRSPS
jgi:hypothetical protein